MENRAKTGKYSIFQSFEGDFSHLSLNGRNKLSQKILKNYVFKQILNHPLNFEHFPSLISGINLNIYHALLFAFN